MGAALVVSILAVLLALYAGKKGNDKMLASAFVLLTLFWAIRYQWGNDYDSYLQSFHMIGSSGIGLFDFSRYSELRVTGDYAWTFLLILAQPIGFFGLIIVLSIFENYAVYRFIKKYAAPQWYWLGVFIYCFDVQFFLIGASMMRQWLSMCIFLFAVDFIENRKFLPYLLLALLATMFHISGSLLILAYPIALLCEKGFSNKNLFWIIPFMMVWIFLAPTLFSNNIDLLSLIDDEAVYLSRYENSESRGAMSLIGFLVGYIIPFIPMLLTGEEKGIMRVLAVLYAITAVLLPFQFVIALTSRLGMYFALLGIAVWPTIMSLNFHLGGKKLVCLGVLLILIFLNVRGFLNFFTLDNWIADYSEYHTIFEVPWQ